MNPMKSRLVQRLIADGLTERLRTDPVARDALKGIGEGVSGNSGESQGTQGRGRAMTGLWLILSFTDAEVIAWRDALRALYAFQPSREGVDHA